MQQLPARPSRSRRAPPHPFNRIIDREEGLPDPILALSTQFVGSGQPAQGAKRYQTACLVMLLDLVAETGMPSLLGLPFLGVRSSILVGSPILPSCFKNGSGSSSSTLTMVCGAQSPRATRIAAVIGGTP